MATGDVVSASDGMSAIQVGFWAKDKLHYIKRYCDIFNSGMRNTWSVRTYVDLFAGPGKCIVEGTGEELDGSPLIALTCKSPFTHYFFNDLNPELIKPLMFRGSSFGFASIEYSSLDCNAAVDQIVKRLPPNSLDFCFIDPLSWEIRFASIRRLTQKRRMDLAITFHVGSIKRVADHPPQELLDFFPDSSWQAQYRKAGETGKLTGRVLLDSYNLGLKSLGYNEIRDYIIEKNEKNVPLYHLVFASKHKRGADFWDKITGRSVAGQVRMRISE